MMLISDENKVGRFEKKVGDSDGLSDHHEGGILFAFTKLGELETSEEYTEDGYFGGHHYDVFGEDYNVAAYGIYFPHLNAVFSYYNLTGPEERALCRRFPECIYKTERGHKRP